MHYHHDHHQRRSEHFANLSPAPGISPLRRSRFRRPSRAMICDGPNLTHAFDDRQSQACPRVRTSSADKPPRLVAQARRRTTLFLVAPRRQISWDPCVRGPASRTHAPPSPSFPFSSPSLIPPPPWEPDHSGPFSSSGHAQTVRSVGKAKHQPHPCSAWHGGPGSSGTPSRCRKWKP